MLKDPSDRAPPSKIDYVPVGSPSSGGGHRSGGDTNTFCDRHVRETVVSPRFVREPEKGKEDECADDGEETSHLNAGHRHLSLVPHNRGDLFDCTKVGVGSVPVLIRREGTRGQVEVHGIASQRNGTEDFNAGETHEAEIPAGTQVPVGCKELLELCSSDCKFTNGPDCEMRSE